MNSIMKVGLRACMGRIRSPTTNAISFARKGVLPPAYSRTLWHMCSSHSKDNRNDAQLLKPKHLNELCECGCRGLAHTNGERELVDFLKNEIVAEKKAQKKALTSELDGFKVQTDGSEVTLVKESPGETVTINFNVNHSVDTDHEPGLNPNADKADVGEMKSRPSFEIDIKRKGQTLSFSCSFIEPSTEQGEEGYNDIFGIDEITIFEGEWEDKTYSVSGDVLDGYLYDLLMTVLEEKGISNDFVDKMSDLATAHEHSKYISLLENLNKFVSSQ